MRNHPRPAVRGLLVVVLLLMMSSAALSSVRAQDGEPDDTDGDLVSFHGAEAIFPAVLRSWIMVNAPLDTITGARLSFTQNSGFERTFVIDPPESVLGDYGQSVELEFEWPLTDLPIPHPFEAVTYTWDLSVTEGDDAETGEPVLVSATGTLMMADTAAGAWQSAGEAPLILHWTSPNLAGDLMREDLMRVYRALKTRTGNDTLAAFAIFERNAEFCEAVEDEESGETRQVVLSFMDSRQYPCAPEDYFRLYRDAGIIPIQRTVTGYDTLQNQLVDALVQQMYSSYWEGADLPAWFTQGVAMLYRLRPDYAALQLVRTAAETDSLFPLSNLEAQPPADATYPQQALWNAESYTLVLFLADQYGVPALYDLAQFGGEETGGFDAALRELAGIDLNALWRTFTNWLSTSQPDSAIGWTPYRGVTPTPSNTPTSTPLPPTRTPTRTPTGTPVPTSTFLGAQVATPVRVRVTVTEPARTATNTPLPPGSLPTAIPATESPSDSGANANDDNRAMIAGLVALVGGGVLLMGLGVLLSLRRKA